MKPIKLITVKSIEALAASDEKRKRIWAFNAEEKAALWALHDKAHAALKGAACLDTEKVREALDVANGRAQAHVYYSCDVYMLAMDAERRLIKSCVPKKARAGTIVVAMSGVPTSKAYNRKSHTAVATVLTLRRGGEAWYLDAVGRVDRYTGPGGEERIDTTISADARDAIVAQALSGYKVRAETTEPAKT